jgi:hypothetical protein
MAQRYTVQMYARLFITYTEGGWGGGHGGHALFTTIFAG